MTPNDPRYVIVFFVALWVAVGFVIAQISGWGQLSRYYRMSNPFEGRRWHFRSARMRFGMNCSNCLTIGANSQGLYLALLFLFRIGSPPLFIPWQDISVRFGKTLWWPWTEFRFRQAPGVFLRVFGNFGKEIRAQAGQFWPTENLPAQSQF